MPIRDFGFVKIFEDFDKELVDMALERIANNRFKGKLPTIADLTAIK